MKLTNKLYLLVLMLFSMSFLACYDDYLTDGGTATAETELTAYECLQQNQYQMFDTLIQIIDRLELQDEINNAGTFFAPTDYSIERYLTSRTDTLRDQTNVEDTVFTLNNMLDEIQPEELLQYVFNEPITLEAASTSGDLYTTEGGTEITIKRIMTTEDQYYVYSDSPVYFLYYCKEGMEEERCQTTGVRTQNGNGVILHTLNYQHVFGLFSEESED
ncbi:fasciclin domain-containing protein [Fulvivirga maritima]|uniref:fasciclin domain-containing protein n=1 Tax=Fulvivirga maritima TaxID=2904247 RepID=UPI001F3FB86B|nr:fasciclin domain-containing protein [Fulvivirga maritima]UII26165.1 fasciclin domain-containing protein [Fulvivirga maritima]